MFRNLTTTVIQPNWFSTTEGDAVLKQFYDPRTFKRKLFGILEKPSIPVHFEEVSYKLFFIGKSGRERSRTLADLAGSDVILYDSNGIHKTNLYWPTKIWDKVILFRLHCWEAGDCGIKKFSHILQACTEKADALVFIFMFTDVNSLHEISQNITRLQGSEENQPSVIVIGTDYVSENNPNVSVVDLKDFESKWHLNVIKFPTTSENQKTIHRISPVLNYICEQLWIRDQEFILKQSFDKFSFQN